MEREFISYTEAVALKELGFDEPCFVYWVFDGVEVTFSTSHNRSGWSMIGFKNNQMTKKAGLCTAPTYSQVFRWFREKYNLMVCLNNNEFHDRFYFKIKGTQPRLMKEIILKRELTYEEAELECLKKLIEIVKENVDKQR